MLQGKGYEYTAAVVVQLATGWTKVATVSQRAPGALLLFPTSDATTFDIEWEAVAVDAAAPAVGARGVPIWGGDDFGFLRPPIGDIYCRSASGQKLIVKTGA